MLKKNKLTDLASLTSLRFLLATWIVVYHLYVVIPHGRSPGTAAFSPWLNTIVSARVAVIIFFTLSGFILALNYPPDQNWDSVALKKFGVARLSRVYPVYLLGLIAVAPVVISATMGVRAILLRRAVSLTMNLLMVQAWAGRSALSWNGPGWSLSNEAFFYLCFPFIGAFFFRISTVRKAAAVMFGLWIILVLPATAAIALHLRGYNEAVSNDATVSLLVPVLSFNPLLNLPAFLAGITACRCFCLLKASCRFDGRGYLFYAPSFILLLVLTSCSTLIGFPLLLCGLALPPALGIILGLAIGDRYLCRVLSNRVLVFLGKASYAEYLLHYPIRAAFQSLGVSWTSIQQILYVAAVVAVSSLVFRFFEEPLQRWIRSVFLSRKATHLAEPSGGAQPVAERTALTSS